MEDASHSPSPSAASASNASAFQYPIDPRRRETRPASSGPSAGTALPRSAQQSAAPSAAARTSATPRTGTPRENRRRKADDTEGEEREAFPQSVEGAVACDRPPDAETRPRRDGACSRDGNETRPIEAWHVDDAASPADENQCRRDRGGRSESRHGADPGCAAVEERPHEEHTDRTEDRVGDPGSRRARSRVHGAPRYHHPWSGPPPGKAYNSFTLRTPPPQWQPTHLQDFRLPRVARNVIRLPHPHRALLLGLAVLGLVMLSSVLTETASARSCSQQVIDDWFDDGRVDKIYPLPCYTQAIKSLPSDLLIYGNAEDEIGRALAFAKQGKPDPGGASPHPDDARPDGDDLDYGRDGHIYRGRNGLGRPDGYHTDTVARDGDGGATDTSGPSSVPIPLLVLGGLAVVLLAAGSAGYLRRRKDGGGPGDGPAAPPVS